MYAWIILKTEIKMAYQIDNKTICEFKNLVRKKPHYNILMTFLPFKMNANIKTARGSMLSKTQYVIII